MDCGAEETGERNSCSKNLYQFRQGVLRIWTMVVVVVGSDEPRTFVRISLVLCNICHGRKRRRKGQEDPKISTFNSWDTAGIPD